MKRPWIIFVVALPVFFGIAAYYVVSHFNPSCNVSRIEFVLNAIIVCATTFSGFILTSVSILVGLSGSPIMRKIRQDGGMAELRCRYTESLILGAVLIIFCICAGITVDTTGLLKGWVLSYGAGLLVAYTISTIGAGYYLLRITASLDTPPAPVVSKKPKAPQGEYRLDE
jgi:hypothetical protein